MIRLQILKEKSDLRHHGSLKSLKQSGWNEFVIVIVIFIPLRVRVLLLMVHQNSSSVSGWTENYAE